MLSSLMLKVKFSKTIERHLFGLNLYKYKESLDWMDKFTYKNIYHTNFSKFIKL